MKFDEAEKGDLVEIGWVDFTWVHDDEPEEKLQTPTMRRSYGVFVKYEEYTPTAGDAEFPPLKTIVVTSTVDEPNEEMGGCMVYPLKYCTWMRVVERATKRRAACRKYSK